MESSTVKISTNPASSATVDEIARKVWDKTFHTHAWEWVSSETATFRTFQDALAAAIAPLQSKVNNQRDEITQLVDTQDMLQAESDQRLRDYQDARVINGKLQAEHQALRIVHEVFCVSLRKALGIECTVPISDILDTAVAMNARRKELQAELEQANANYNRVCDLDFQFERQDYLNLQKELEQARNQIDSSVRDLMSAAELNTRQAKELEQANAEKHDLLDDLENVEVESDETWLDALAGLGLKPIMYDLGETREETINCIVGLYGQQIEDLQSRLATAESDNRQLHEYLALNDETENFDEWNKTK